MAEKVVPHGQKESESSQDYEGNRFGLGQMRAISKKLSAKDKRKIAMDIRDLRHALKKVKKVCLPFFHGRLYITVK